ncbi:MAG: hypothetical protein IJH34_12300 [Romboutsia sp.]|nr:hypothetical protein [Romboutsia sp.]
MGVFGKKTQIDKRKLIKTSNTIIKIQIVSLSIGRNDNNIIQCATVINVNEKWSFNEFIKVLIQDYCPKISKKSGTWILEYKKRSLAVFNSGTGSINIINESFIDISMKELTADNNAPQIFLHYIGEESIEETAKTMLGR